jgi:hypothetical protein
VSGPFRGEWRAGSFLPSRPPHPPLIPPHTAIDPAHVKSRNDLRFLQHRSVARRWAYRCPSQKSIALSAHGTPSQIACGSVFPTAAQCGIPSLLAVCVRGVTTNGRILSALHVWKSRLTSIGITSRIRRAVKRVKQWPVSQGPSFLDTAASGRATRSRLPAHPPLIPPHTAIDPPTMLLKAPPTASGLFHRNFLQGR